MKLNIGFSYGYVWEHKEGRIMPVVNINYPEPQERIYGLGQTEEAWLDFLTATLATMLESYDSQNAWLEAIPVRLQNQASELGQTLKNELLESVITEIMNFKSS